MCGRLQSARRRSGGNIFLTELLGIGTIEISDQDWGQFNSFESMACRRRPDDPLRQIDPQRE